MTDHDHVRELTDRIEARRRRGESWEAEFEIEWHALTDAEKGEFMALMDQRKASGEERLEAVTENVRLLTLMFEWRQGAITAEECVARIRGVLTS